MDVVSSLRILWRFRIVVMVLAIVSALLGLSMAYKIKGPTALESKQYDVGIASAQALVDTPSSQVADLGSEDTASVDIATLSTRAGLLANLMTTSPMKDEIAVRAGIKPDELLAVPPATDAAPGSGASTSPGVKVKAADPNASILKVTIPELQSGQIPILSVRTQAPDETTAGKLATASIAVLTEQLATRADDDKVPAFRRVVVRPLGGAQTSTELRGPGKKMAIVAGLALFLFGCAAILGGVALVRGWQTASEQEREALHALPDDDDGGDEEEDDVAVAPVGEPAPSWAAASLTETKRWPSPEPPAVEHTPPAAEHRA